MKKHVTPLLDQAAPAKGTAMATRRAARAALEPKLGRLQGIVLRGLVDRGSHGATDEELAAELSMKDSTCRARRIELTEVGLVIDSGRKRKLKSGFRGAVWVAAAASRMHQAQGEATPTACDHTIDHRTGSWVERTRNGERIVECGKCGKYFGHMISHEIARPRPRAPGG